MSLVCVETGRMIMFGEPLFCGTRDEVKFISGISKEAVTTIPPDQRRAEPCTKGDGGVDIYRASSTRNNNGAYCWSGIAKVGFLFSVSEETAKRYLPHHRALYDLGVLSEGTVLATEIAALPKDRFH